MERHNESTAFLGKVKTCCSSFPISLVRRQSDHKKILVIHSVYKVSTLKRTI